MLFLIVFWTLEDHYIIALHCITPIHKFYPNLTKERNFQLSNIPIESKRMLCIKMRNLYAKVILKTELFKEGQNPYYIVGGFAPRSLFTFALSAYDFPASWRAELRRKKNLEEKAPCLKIDFRGLKRESLKNLTSSEIWPNF